MWASLFKALSLKFVSRAAIAPVKTGASTVCMRVPASPACPPRLKEVSSTSAGL